MSVISILLYLVCLFWMANDTTLPKNEVGKIVFEEVIEVEELRKDVLYKNALHFASKVTSASKKKASLDASYGSGVIRKKGSFYVYTQGLFTPQIHGEIFFILELEVADGYYKYTFSDFIFQYYRRNRYGQYTPVSGKKKALEEEKFAGMQKTWDEHKILTKSVIQNYIEALKPHMKE